MSMDSSAMLQAGAAEVKEQPWTCPHCRGHSLVLSVTDDRVGTCESCGFAFPTNRIDLDGSTWREQADLTESTGASLARVRSDRYRIIRPLASGAQARILLAHHRYLDQICVIKVLGENQDWQQLAEARLQAEARAAVRVSHVNVARFLDCDCIDGTWYYVLEYVAGEDLRRVVHAVGRLAWQQVVHVGEQVAAGLAAIHSAGLIHRDVKPSNVMLRCDGLAKIMDLGLVKADGAAPDLSLTHDGQILGTPYYMAPEQFTSESALTAQADIYALGAALYFLLAGKPPHQGGSVVDLANRHKRDPVVWADDVVRGVPSWLRHVVEMCMAKRPEHRFVSAEALREALCCGTDVVTALPAGDADHGPRGVVVAAFENLSRQADDDWIGDALAEFISSRLLEVEHLHVADRHSLDKVLTKEGSARPWQVEADELVSAAGKLGAGLVILGAFQRSGASLRVTIRALGRADSPASRISASVSGPADDLFALEDQLADRVVSVVAQDQSLVRRGRVGRGAEAPEAQEKYVRGRRAFADGDYAAAITLAQEALSVDSEYVDAVSLIGACYARVGDYDRAVEYHQREEAIARRDGDRRRLAEALGNIGVMYYYKGQYGLAYDFLEQARNISVEQSFHPDSAKYEANLGFVLMRLNRDAEAETAFAQAIDINKKYGDLVSLSWPYNGMGGVLLKQRRYAEAQEYYRRALALADEIGDRVNVGVCHMNLGRCACLMGEFALAEANFDDALRELEGTDFWNGLTLVYEYMADMYLQEGDVDRAMDAIDKRLELAQKHHNQRMEASAWEQKAKAHEQAGAKDEAFRCLKRSLEVSQRPDPHESLSRYLNEITKRESFR